MSSRSIRLRREEAPELHLRVWDEGSPACFLVHGFGEGGFVWDRFARALQPFGSAAAIDLRGHGDSGHDSGQRYTVSDHVDDVLFALDELRLERFVLLGHSMGAAVAIDIAQRLGERVLGLVVVDGGPDPNPLTMHHILEQFRSQPRRYVSVEQYATRLMQLLPLAPPEVLQELAWHALRSHEDGSFELKCDPQIAEVPMGIDDDALWRALGTLHCPVLIVRGAASAGLSRTSAERMMTQLRCGELRTVPFAGHAVMIDNPAGFYSAVIDFITDAIRRRSVGGVFGPSVPA